MARFLFTSECGAKNGSAIPQEKSAARAAAIRTLNEGTDYRF
jgi:hypothetical protein